MPSNIKKLVLASRNEKKLKELAAILAPYGIETVSVGKFPTAPEVKETGTTFAENAALKAEAIAAHTGLPTLADDSGLCVDVLDGAPGVYSARFAGEEGNDEKNNNLLLEKLSGLPEEKRKASFVCLLALARPDEETVFFEGKCDGVIINEKCGDEGFGYDPLFFSPELGKTFAEAVSAEKHRVSHRGRALNKFTEWLQENKQE